MRQEGKECIEIKIPTPRRARFRRLRRKTAAESEYGWDRKRQPDAALEPVRITRELLITLFKYRAIVP